MVAMTVLSLIVGLMLMAGGALMFISGVQQRISSIGYRILVSILLFLGTFLFLLSLATLLHQSQAK
jgi:hypothetical protein